MHIFCRETQAHLDLNPHLVSSSSTSNLITPELWLKNCRSRSTSPNSERSKSPTEPTKHQEKEAPKTQKSPLPLITIAPTVKLMKQKLLSEEPPLRKSPEAKKDVRNKMNLRKRRTSKCSATVTSQSVRQRTTTPKAQDLRICSPSERSSPVSLAGNAIHSPPNPINHPVPPPFTNSMFGMPPPVFMDNAHPHLNDLRHPAMFPPRMSFMPRPGIPMPHERPRLPPLINFPQPLGQTPPVTVLVPYPVLLPLPIPIPIPIPLSSFLLAHRGSKVKTESKNEDTEGPLDFTMNNNKRDEEINSPNIESANISEVSNETNVNIERNADVNERLEEERFDNGTLETANNPEQTLPKFKITRLGNKMAKIVTKPREPSESTRPLRKRRRLVEVVDDEALLTKPRKIVEV